MQICRLNCIQPCTAASQCHRSGKIKESDWKGRHLFYKLILFADMIYLKNHKDLQKKKAARISDISRVGCKIKYRNYILYTSNEKLEIEVYKINTTAQSLGITLTKDLYYHYTKTNKHCQEKVMKA